MSSGRQLTRFKLLFLGDATVGKSSLAERLAGGDYTNKLESTIGAAFRHVKYGDLALDIWDTAGQERFNSIIPMYFRDTDIALLVYDSNKLYTTERLKKYINTLWGDTCNSHILIIGNKIDLPEVKNNLESIQEQVQVIFAQEINNYKDNITFLVASAQDNIGIKEILNKIVEICKTKNLELKKTTKKYGLNIQDNTQEIQPESYSWFSSCLLF